MEKKAIDLKKKSFEQVRTSRRERGHPGPLVACATRERNCSLAMRGSPGCALPLTGSESVSGQGCPRSWQQLHRFFKSPFLEVYINLVQQDVRPKDKAALPRLHFSGSQFSIVARSGSYATTILLLAALVALTSCKLWTIRPLESKTQPSSSSSSQQFDAAAFVDSIWQSKVVPTMLEKAVYLSAVLTALDADVEAAKKQYSSGDAGGTTHFLVKGTGRIRGVESRSQNRTLTLTLPNYQGKTEVTIQIGPVFRGTALRDAVGFIQFNQFVNQLQFADVGNKLNERVAALVVKDFDLATAPGKQVSFYGAFTLTERSKIIITPTQLATGGQP